MGTTEPTTDRELFPAHHRLALLDKENLTAQCQICGPGTPVHRKTNGVYQCKKARDEASSRANKQYRARVKELRAYARELAERAPNLTDEQRERLNTLLGGDR